VAGGGIGRSPACSSAKLSGAKLVAKTSAVARDGTGVDAGPPTGGQPRSRLPAAAVAHTNRSSRLGTRKNAYPGAIDTFGTIDVVVTMHGFCARMMVNMNEAELGLGNQGSPEGNSAPRPLRRRSTGVTSPRRRAGRRPDH